MAFTNAQQAKVLLGDFNMTVKATKVDLPYSVEMLDITTLADTARRKCSGQGTGTAAIEGYTDLALATDEATWTTQQPLTYGSAGMAIGAPVEMVDALRAQIQFTSPTGGVSGFSLAAQADGVVGIGVSLHDLGAETADGNATSVDNGAATTAGAVAHLHVTAYSGLTNAVITVADSADNSSFATIGTFTTVTAVTGERINIAGNVRRYVRATVDVTGTGSVTYAVALARL